MSENAKDLATNKTLELDGDIHGTGRIMDLGDGTMMITQASGASGSWEPDTASPFSFKGVWDWGLGVLDRGWNGIAVPLGADPIALTLPTITVQGNDRSGINRNFEAEIESKNVWKMGLAFGLVLGAGYLVYKRIK